MGRVWTFDLWDGMGGVLLARRRGGDAPLYVRMFYCCWTYEDTRRRSFGLCQIAVYKQVTQLRFTTIQKSGLRLVAIFVEFI